MPELEGFTQSSFAHDGVEHTLVFTRTKHGANRVVKQLDRANIQAAAIHGNKSQGARTRAMDGHQTESIRRALQAGLNITAGTDAGGHEHNINAREIDLLGQAGLSPTQAIQTATGWAARALGLQDEIGTLEVGKVADLVAFDGDPLTDLSLLHKTQPKLVVQSGERRVDRTGAGLSTSSLIA